MQKLAKLAKPVVWETVNLYHGRPLVVILEPGGYIELRPKGIRGEVYRVAFEQIMSEAIKRVPAPIRNEWIRNRRRRVARAAKRISQSRAE